MSAIIILLGLTCIVMGICFHLGFFRGVIVYWTTATSSIYSTMPLGIALLLLGIGSQLPSSDLRKIFLTVAISFGVIGIVFGLTMPQFLTPWWFRYLRENHDEIMLILLEDAAKDYSGWKKRTSTLEGLAEWADDIQRRTTFID